MEQDQAAASSPVAETSAEPETAAKEDAAEADKKKSKKHAAKTFTQKEMDVAVRITSYNVCYTKLLRELAAA